MRAAVRSSTNDLPEEEENGLEDLKILSEQAHLNQLEAEALEAAAHSKRSPLEKGPLVMSITQQPVEEVTEVTEEEEDPLPFALQFALAKEVTAQEHAAYEAAQARKAEKHAKGQAAALARFQEATRKAAPPEKKQAPPRPRHNKAWGKLGPKGRPVAGAAVLQGHPAVPPGGNSKGKAAEGVSQQAGAKGKNKVPEQSTKKAAAGMSF